MQTTSADDLGLSLAREISAGADCSRRQVGAVLVRRDGTIVTRGRNGAPLGEVGCLAGGCPRASSGVAPGSSYDTGAGTCIALHAEQNALLQASWIDMVDSTLYVTDKPCDGCFRMIKGTPVVRVVTPSWIWNRKD